jgi:hypothetical protein
MPLEAGDLVFDWKLRGLRKCIRETAAGVLKTFF